MMPEGLLSAFTPEQTINPLFSYLMTHQQVELPGGK